MPTVGVVVFSLPGMKSLDRCLKSVEWADSVVVHEAGSTSALPEKSTDWVCSLWGEECIEPLLREELLALREQDLKSTAPAYRVPIRSRVLGRWLKGSLWGTSPSLRVRRQAASPPYDWCDSPEEGRRAKRLGGWLSDYSSSDLSVALSRLNMVGEISAASLAARGRVIAPRRAVVGALKVFLGILMANRLATGGIASLTLASLAAYGVVLSAAKAHEKSVRQTGPPDERTTCRSGC
jgi:hypothetical protein